MASVRLMLSLRLGRISVFRHGHGIRRICELEETREVGEMRGDRGEARGANLGEGGGGGGRGGCGCGLWVLVLGYRMWFLCEFASRMFGRCRGVGINCT